MIVVDVETDGLNPRINSILSIGAVDFYDMSNVFYIECRSETPRSMVSKDALDVNGFSSKDLKSKKKVSLRTAMLKFISWTKTCKSDVVFAGHNVSFDRDFLNEAAKRCKLKWNCGFRTVDLHSLFFFHLMKMNIMPSQTFSLNSVLSNLNLPEEDEPHNALKGAICAMLAIRKLTFFEVAKT